MAEGRHVPRTVSIKDVAARAGVSLGTVSNVLNRPDRSRADDPATGSRRRSPSSATCATSRPGSCAPGSSRAHRPTSMLDAAQPVLHRRRPRAPRTPPRRPASRCSSATATRTPTASAPPRPAPGAAGPGRAHHPGRPRRPALDERRRARHARSCSSTAARPARHALLGRRRRRARRAARRRAPPRAGAPADRVRRRADLASAQVRDRLRGRPPGAGRRGARAGPADRAGRPRRSDRRGGRGGGERLAGLPATRRPTAAFCANDLLALGLLQQCVTLGLRVPDDLAIVGYDDIDFAAAAAVPLTSVRQPRVQLGRDGRRAAPRRGVEPRPPAPAGGVHARAGGPRLDPPPLTRPPAPGPLVTRGYGRWTRGVPRVERP